MPTVFKRSQALTDLFLIGERISLEDPDAADRILDQLEEKFNLIATQPLMGRERSELIGELRSFVFGNYVIFYFPLEDGIDILRVMDGRQDIGQEFGKVTEE